MEQERVERFERTFYERDIDSTYLELYRREQVLPRAFAYIHAGLDVGVQAHELQGPWR